MSQKKNKTKISFLPLSGTVLRRTGKAALIDLGQGDQDWFPFAQCPDLAEYEVGEEAEFDCPLDLVEEKGLDYKNPMDSKE